MEPGQLVDHYGRRHNYLRLAVTDRCNLRCTYCMGPEGVRRLDRKKILKYEEILEVVQAAAGIGIRRIRVTGGEPLVRKGLAWLIREIHRIPEIEDLSLTTNGLLLAEQAEDLHQAGLDRVNISLDSLDPATFKAITRGGDLGRVLAGVEAALKVGLHPIKINTVLMRGINDHEVPNLLRLAFERPLHMRFIEYMPIGEAYSPALFLPAWFVEQTAVRMGFRLSPVGLLPGNGPARVYSLGGTGTVSFITPLSRHFCHTCNRLRLTPEGNLRPCLYWPEELPIRPVLGNLERIRGLFWQAVACKPRSHQMEHGGRMPAGKHCMSRIGG